MPDKAFVKHEKENSAVTKTIHSFRTAMRAHDYVVSAVFVGTIKGEFGFLFSDQMPDDIRIQLLDDMEEAIQISRRLLLPTKTAD